jgi:hypothetical protein
MALPKYAQSTPRNYLVRIECRGKCNESRFAKLSKLPWLRHGPNEDQDMWAVCLVCGYKATDSYNWLVV